MTSLQENKAPHKKNKSCEKRKQTLKKKASELATLCDVSVCLGCLNPDSKERVVKVLMAYKDHAAINNEGNEGEQGKEKVVDKAPKVLETWDSRSEYLPEEALMDVSKFMDRQLQAVNQLVEKEESGKKRAIMKDERKSKIVHDVDDDDGSQTVGLITKKIYDSVASNWPIPIQETTGISTVSWVEMRGAAVILGYQWIWNYVCDKMDEIKYRYIP